MNIHFENVNLYSNSGPNSFAKKLTKYMSASGCTFNPAESPDYYLSFIESRRKEFDAPMFQRLDGIYFNVRFDYKLQNSNIRETYNRADGVIFQSDFNKKLTTKYFGEHKNSRVIHNGADIDAINDVPKLKNPVIDSFDKVWCCASHWANRPHKRLGENIRYFLEHAADRDCLIICGPTGPEKENYNHDRIFFVGEVPSEMLISIYNRSDYFIHLAWLDHCPNVVVDARASGCKIICSSAGGTQEIAGPSASVIVEDEWDFQPLDLYSPPKMDFTRVWEGTYFNSVDMNHCAARYKSFLQGNYR